MLFSKPKSKLEPAVLKALFDQQVRTLVDKGYHGLLNLSEADFRAKLDSLWQRNISKVEDYYFSKDREIPFLVVVKAGDARKSLELAGARTELDLTQIKNKEETPQADIYLLLDVEDGREEVAKSPAESLKRFSKKGRRPLTLNESLALLVHQPEILKDHYVISAGTFIPKNNAELPLIWLLDDDNSPELHYAWFDIAHGHYGSASCALRLH
ncbi:MAG TPA: DUF5701 family protein [Candidatus Paceibacterota bacterium]|nr:DUF5701 family protein [Candidatus Paceibacterota bacterium]